MIPGDATLLFDVELINIGDSPPTTNVFKEIDENQDKQLSRDEVNLYVRTLMFSYPSQAFHIFKRKFNLNLILKLLLGKWISQEANVCC